MIIAIILFNVMFVGGIIGSVIVDERSRRKHTEHLLSIYKSRREAV